MPLQGLDITSVICLDANKMALPEIKGLVQRFLKEKVVFIWGDKPFFICSDIM